MNYSRIQKLPSVESIIERFPLSPKAELSIMKNREEIKNIISGKDSRLLIIVGPCSAWPKEAVIEYAARLKSLEPALDNVMKIVMRTYIQKPRTTTGWTGPMNQPDLFSPPNIEKGMFYAREMMVNIIEMGVAIADECLFTHNARGFAELVSWFAIGARSSEDHEHRVIASAAHCAVGMKNPTHGSIKVAINSVLAAQNAQAAAMDGYAIQTHGNPYAHLVLRGSNQNPNYTLPHLLEACHLMQSYNIKNPAILIDASHDNCIIDGKKQPEIQPQVIMNVLDIMQKNHSIKKLIKGFMLESFLKTGHQNIEYCTPENIDLNGLSITDPCLGFSETKQLLLDLALKLKQQ